MAGTLKFIADEGVEKEIVQTLRKHFDCVYVAETMQGAPDTMILTRAQEENRILVTLDKDFGELVYRLHQVHAGIVLCRVQSLPIREAAKLVEDTIHQYGDELHGAFTVIQPKNIRIRKL